MGIRIQHWRDLRNLSADGGVRITHSHDKRNKYNHLHTVRVRDDGGGDIGPVEGYIQQTHATTAGSNEVDSMVATSKPA
jgi:hypothetical protein